VFAWRGAEFGIGAPNGDPVRSPGGASVALGAVTRGRPKLQPPGGRRSWSRTTRTGRRQWIGMVDIEPVLGQRWPPKGGAAAVVTEGDPLLCSEGITRDERTCGRS
jgi:hypothetical protein